MVSGITNRVLDRHPSRGGIARVRHPRTMRLSLFDYHLPQKLIAQEPMRPRERARLLVLQRQNGTIQHKHVLDIIDQLHHGDVVVVNNSKVIPARLLGKKMTGGRAEIFLLKKISSNSWECLVRAKGTKEGLRVVLPLATVATVVRRIDRKVFLVSFSKNGSNLEKFLQKFGETPTPPYIKKKTAMKEYQTVYASDAKAGSVAAPTAGLHFTKKLLRKIEKKGVTIEEVTLHVGLGTFEPVEHNDITKHSIHKEYAEVDPGTFRRIAMAKKRGQSIVAVGTTSARVLESIVAQKIKNPSKPLHGWVDIFIYPGFTFNVIDALLTNFHLPKSTLFMLVSAFAGRTSILRAYREAVKLGYRFYSFGDAMFIS